jgi:hypothetical protein
LELLPLNAQVDSKRCAHIIATAVKVSHRDGYLHFLVQYPNNKQLQVTMKENQLFGSFMIPLYEGDSAQICHAFVKLVK